MEEQTAIKGKLDLLFKNHIIQEYISEGGCGGYLGHENRTDEMDLVLEKQSKFNAYHYPKSFGFSDDTISEWLCSKDARKFMDECNSLKYFRENVFERITNY